MEVRFIYITCKDRAEATLLGRQLVEARLAACANILDGMASLYWWEGKVVEDQETVLILKSRAELLDVLTAKVRELHSYDLPCVIALPITEGNQAYLQWIQKETT
ncbi:MAG: divalent-cation tolerance protein CutA [Bacteroidota bacterium]